VCARKTTPTIFRGKHFSLRPPPISYHLLARVPVFGIYTSVSIFQMDLATKFKMVATCQQTKITSLKIDTPYPIERADRVVTKYGEAILTTLQAPETFLKVFLPRRYGTLFGDEDLRSINDKTVSLNLKYLGTNPTTNSYILELD